MLYIKFPCHEHKSTSPEKRLRLKRSVLQLIRDGLSLLRRERPCARDRVGGTRWRRRDSGYLEEAPQPPLPVIACSSRLRGSADEYLRSKYPDHVLPNRIQWTNIRYSDGHNSALLVTHLIFLTQLTSSRFSDGHKFALLVTCLKFCTL